MNWRGRLLLLFLIYGCASAFAGEPVPRVLVVVGKTKGSELWARETCTILHVSLTHAYKGAVDVDCFWLQENNFLDKEVQNLRWSEPLLVAQVDYREMENGAYLRFAHLRGNFRQQGWELPLDEPLSQLAGERIASILEHPTPLKDIGDRKNFDVPTLGVQRLTRRDFEATYGSLPKARTYTWDLSRPSLFDEIRGDEERREPDTLVSVPISDNSILQFSAQLKALPHQSQEKPVFMGRLGFYF